MHSTGHMPATWRQHDGPLAEFRSRGGARATRASMDRADFEQKFRLVRAAATQAGLRLSDQKIARIFETGTRNDARSFETAVVKWSQRKKGWRHFEDALLEPLFRAVDSQAPPEQFRLQPFDRLRLAFIAAGLIGPADVMPDPMLCETLRGLRTIGDVVHLLRGRGHNAAWSQEFKRAFDAIPECQDRLIGLFFRAVEERMNVRGHLHVLTMAAGTMTYVWEATEGRPELLKLASRLEAAIGELKPKMVFVAEPLSYIATLHGRHGAFRKNIERMITDPGWRRADFKERLHYCAVVPGKPAPNALARRVAVGRNIAEHLATRRHLAQILCHDIGRVIEVYPDLVKYRRHRLLAETIKAGTLDALRDVDISRRLRTRAGELLTRERALIS
jgi:hypothetical protein